MAINTSAFSPEQLKAIANRNPTWGTPTAPKTTMPTTPTAPASTMPAATTNQNAMTTQTGVDFSGLKPSYGINVQGSTNNSASNSGLSQMGNQALQPLLGTGQGSMPQLIDSWVGDALSKMTVNQNDILNTINQVNNVKANRNLLGGTEMNNLTADMLTRLISPTLQNQASLLTQALGSKASIMPQLIGLTQQSGSTGAGQSSGFSYNQSPDDYQIIASILNNQL